MGGCGGLPMGSRIHLDAYYTPGPLARALVDLLPIVPRSRVVEPSVGGGAFARALRAGGAHVEGVDVSCLASGLADCDDSHIGDWLTWRGRADWVVGNPPYKHAEAHIRHALEVAPRVAMLLRLAMLESQKRAPFWEAHPPRKVWVLSERPSFTGGGTDSAAYG